MKPGIPAYDAGQAIAQGRPDVLRRALDRMIEPRSQLMEVLSDRAIALLVDALDDVREDFVAGIIDAGPLPERQAD